MIGVEFHKEDGFIYARAHYGDYTDVDADIPLGLEVYRKTALRPGVTLFCHRKGESPIYAAKELDDYKAFLKALRADDEVGIANLVKDGKLTQIDKNTLCKALNMETAGRGSGWRVRFTEGPLKDTTGIVFMSHLYFREKAKARKS